MNWEQFQEIKAIFKNTNTQLNLLNYNYKKRVNHIEIKFTQQKKW